MSYVLYVILTASTPQATPVIRAAAIYTSKATCLKQADAERRKRSRVITYCVAMSHGEAAMEPTRRSD